MLFGICCCAIRISSSRDSQISRKRCPTLMVGETTRVTFTVDRDAFAWWDGTWRVTPGTYALMVGDSSASLPLAAHVEVGR